MQTYREAYLWASSFLKLHNTKDPAFEAELLLRKSANLERHQLFLKWDETIHELACLRYKHWIEQRALHVPVQYLIGEQEFYGRPFYVDSRVLIPRPETEQLVEQAIERIKKLFKDKSNSSKQLIRILDIGTGSGIIPITLALEVTNDTVLPDTVLTDTPLRSSSFVEIDAVDISSDALDVARKNATNLLTEQPEAPKIRWFQGDTWPSMDEFCNPYDIILSNPPYIDWSDEQQMDKEVKDYEPHCALFAEDQGLAIYKKIIIGTDQYLKKNGWLGFEIGYQQANQVEELLLSSGFVDIERYKDLAGHQRVIFARKK